MQNREPISAASIWPTDVTEGHSPAQTADLWDVSNENHDAALLLREPFADRIGTALLAATALAASFVLGWTGGANWHDFASPAPVAVAQKEAPVPHIAETRPSPKNEGRIESPRRTASNADPAVTGSIPKSVANPRPQVVGAAPTTLNAQAMALGPKQPLPAAPETRPSTIPGWSVVEVRDGTAVLEGPEGVKMAARGDVVPGLGRVDSIVRWGNRWIVATASGLIATP
ncbi:MULTISPECIES: hypothetical protein [unclassified Bradyrhizobium]|uniref:hypothetical protein n=1 Tax=unclassified Bradyrhizobium TaxID=2631580 RepID=UPI000400A819|nr:MULTISPECIES: hypothetical protein [unclassified Bradyrhizobium]QIG95027.1 hypothetical protein G6P99_23215 [Bradyrhizobium sp. 6(2017)]